MHVISTSLKLYWLFFFVLSILPMICAYVTQKRADKKGGKRP